MKTSHWGRVLGPVGLVLLIAALPTFLMAGDSWLGMVNIFLGLAGIATYFATHFRELNQFASSRGTFFAAISGITAVIGVGALVAANYLAVKHPKSWDMTKNQIHTLAPDTTKTLAEMKDEVKILAFYQPGERNYDQFDELFKRYHALSDKLSYTYVDPLKDPLAVKDNDVKETGPRVIVKLGKVEARVTNPTEEELTNALVKVTHSAQKKVYFVTGHGESDLDDKEPTGLTELAKRMENEGLKSEKLSLISTPGVPRDAEAVVVAGPAKGLAPSEVDGLKKYLDEGGKALVMVEPGTPTGLELVLKDWGIALDNGYVFDPISKLFGANPFAPVVQSYGETEITKDFRLNTLFPTAASLTLTSGAVNPKPLAFSMPTAWVESAPEQRPIQQDPGEKKGPLTLAALATKDTKNAPAATKRSDEARLVVVGDRDFTTNGYQSVFGNEDFALNCLSWLSSQTERISIRPRQRDASRIYLTSAQMGGIRFFATELPIAILAFGLAIFFNRRAK